MGKVKYSIFNWYCSSTYNFLQKTIYLNMFLLLIQKSSHLLQILCLDLNIINIRIFNRIKDDLHSIA